MGANSKQDLEGQPVTLLISMTKVYRSTSAYCQGGGVPDPAGMMSQDRWQEVVNSTLLGAPFHVSRMAVGDLERCFRLKE